MGLFPSTSCYCLRCQGRVVFSLVRTGENLRPSFDKAGLWRFHFDKSACTAKQAHRHGRKPTAPAGGWLRHACQEEDFILASSELKRYAQAFVFMPVVRLAGPWEADYEHDLHGAALEPPAANHTAGHHVKPPSSRGLAVTVRLDLSNRGNCVRPWLWQSGFAPLRRWACRARGLCEAEYPVSWDIVALAATIGIKEHNNASCFRQKADK